MYRRVIEESLGPLLRVNSPDHIRWPEVARVLSALTLSDLGPFALKRSGTGGTSTSSSAASPSRQLAKMGGAQAAAAGAYRDLTSLVSHEYAPLPPTLAAYSAAFTTPAPMSLFDVEAAHSHTEYNRAVWSSSASQQQQQQFPVRTPSDYGGAAPVVTHAATTTLLATPIAEVSLFVLPPGRRMQMHDHPGQHVMCRVLHGRLQDVSIDWTHPMGGAAGAARAALNNDLVNLHASYFGTQAGQAAAAQGALGPRLRELARWLQMRQSNPHAAAPVPAFQTAHDGVVVRTTTHLGDADRKVAAARAAAAGDAATAAALSAPPGVVEFSAQTGGGVLHEFSAPPDAPAIFVDVIAPPYFAAPWYIDCNYYKWRGLGGAGAAVRVGDGVVLGIDETTNMVFDDLVAV